MAIDTIIYDILPYSREFDELGNLYYIDRLIIEANTLNQSVTPSITFSDTTSDFITFSTNVRSFSEIPINRLGPLTSVSLTPINTIAWYGVETFIRPVELAMNVANTSRARDSVMHASFPGRTSDASVSISFDINPFSFPEDARHINPILRYLYIDIVTGAETVTPVLVNDLGVETTLTGITNATRLITEFSILATNRIRTVRLDGDFTSSDVVLYDLVIDAYLPGKRALNVG